MKLYGSIGARDLVLSIGVAAIGALGMWPGARGEPDPLALLVWLALTAPACGFACGALGMRVWPAAPVVPAAWMFLVGLADGLAQARDLPRPVWGGVALFGLFAAGFGLGRILVPARIGPRLRPVAAVRGAAVVLCLTGLTGALPFFVEHLRNGAPPSVTARMLDVAPTTLVSECAGVDWMRHPPIYDAASTENIDPSLRSPYDGRLAAGIVFVVGCALACGLDLAARRRDARWPSTATSAPSPRN